MNPIRRLAFCLLNKRNDRALLNQWKAEGRIPENYWGPIQQIAADVEDEFRRENGIRPFIRNESGCIIGAPTGWEKIRDELYRLK
jgi:hypothetical protein